MLPPPRRAARGAGSAPPAIASFRLHGSVELLVDCPEVVFGEEALAEGGAALESHTQLTPLAKLGDGIAAPN